jgi:hypothetical protein
MSAMLPEKGGEEDLKRGLQRKGVGRSGETFRARALLRKVRISALLERLKTC